MGWVCGGEEGTARIDCHMDIFAYEAVQNPQLPVCETVYLTTMRACVSSASVVVRRILFTSAVLASLTGESLLSYSINNET